MPPLEVVTAGLADTGGAQRLITIAARRGGNVACISCKGHADSACYTTAAAAAAAAAYAPVPVLGGRPRPASATSSRLVLRLKLIHGCFGPPRSPRVWLPCLLGPPRHARVAARDNMMVYK